PAVSGTYTYTVSLSRSGCAVRTAQVSVTVGNCGGGPCGDGVRVAESLSSPVAGLRYSYYEHMWSRSVSEIEGKTPVAQAVVGQFSLAPRQKPDYFGFEYTGYINIPADGQYSFYTSSDDASRLWIGSTEVVNNDFMQGMTERSGQICLARGWHPIRVRYIQGAGGLGLQVSWQGPGVAK
ncbi:PA14 domain-containing protein, partial [Nibrella saemangeumensis]|uniref:PA14 domain-containing protein n=1 Tax=Nibrella saemangeumensis TaxID=1084526 RepID=UPI0031ED8FBB